MHHNLSVGKVGLTPLIFDYEERVASPPFSPEPSILRDKLKHICFTKVLIRANPR
jgi:hypothetical protein